VVLLLVVLGDEDDDTDDDVDAAVAGVPTAAALPTAAAAPTAGDTAGDKDERVTNNSLVISPRRGTH
jgi:hypothetical protein